MKTFREIKIVVDESKEEAVRYKDTLELELRKREALIASYPDPKNIQLVIVLGGDGTILKTAHAYDFKPTFLGVNCGHTGALMNEGNPSEVADRILDGKFEIHRFPLLKIEGDGWKGLAMNDVYFNRIAGKAAKFEIKANGFDFRERIVGDGLIICTALGSTGYFVPAGGSILHPKLSAIGLLFMNCRSPFRHFHSALPLTAGIEVALLSPPDEVSGFYDGLELPYFKKIKVRRSNRKVKLAFWEGEDFTKRMIAKNIAGAGGEKCR